MILATRRPRFHFPFKRYLKLFLFAAIVYEVYSVPFTHKLVFDGPLKPFWKQISDSEQKFVQPYAGPILAPLIKPLHFAFQQRRLLERSHELTVLKASLAAKAAEAKIDEKKIADLQHKLAAVKPAESSAANSTAAAVGATTAAGVLATPSPDDMKTASYWSSMEAENAAQIAQKLAPIETARIFLAMKPDQVAEIMNSLPTDYNVKLKEVNLDGGLH